MPSSEKQRGGNATYRHQVGILAHEEQRKLHTAVLNVEAAGQFRLGLGHIKGCPVDLRNGTDEVKDKGKRLIK